jgi:prevent-host-death family protein
MEEIGAFEAKNRLGSLLDEVEKGNEIIITRRGKPVARLVPITSGFDQARTKRAAARIVARSKGASLRGLKIKDLIGEGRA